MKNLFLPAFLSLTTTVFSQETLPPISLRSHSVKGFEAHAIGDSVFVSWFAIQQPSGAKLTFRTLIKPDKTLESIGLPGTIDKIAKIEDRGDKLNFICLSDERKATVFNQITYDKTTKSLSQ